MSDFKFCPECGVALTSCLDRSRQRRCCLRCHRIHYRNPTVGVAVILLENRDVLLTRRSSGQWCIPCGHVEWDEAIEDAARREVFEETGLRCELQSVHSVHSNFHNPERHTVGIWYLGHRIDGHLTAGDDAEQVQFWPLENLPPLAFPTDEKVAEQLRLQYWGV